MKINKLEIGSFGKFKNYELELKQGFQIVYGKNEDGKSTLMAFIKMMFYSKLGSGRDIDKNLRKRYQPWDGSMMSGAVEFEYGGATYRLQKDIGSTPSADKVKLINMSTGDLVSLGKSEEVGKRFFGLDLAGFERSVYINQIGNFSANSNNDEVAEKLMSNLVLSGDENISQQVVMNRLNSAIEDMESKNRKKGILVDARNELDSLRSSRVDVITQEKEQHDNMQEYQRLEAKLKEKKEIQHLLKLNKDKNKLDHLTSLINEMVECSELEKKLEKENFPYSSLTKFLTDCKTLMDDCDKTKGSLEKLRGSNEETIPDRDKLTPIHEEEYKTLNELMDQEKSLAELLLRIDESFIPALTSLINAKNEYQNVDALLKQETDLAADLQKFYEDYQKYEIEKNSKTKDKVVLIDNYEKNKVKWNFEKQSRDQQITSANEKLAIQKTVTEQTNQNSRKQNPMLIFSGVFGVLSILLALVRPMAAIGVVIAAIIGFFAVKSNKQNKTPSKNTNHDLINNLEQELQRLRDENRAKEAFVLEKINEYESSIANITKEIEGIETILGLLKDNSNAYETAIDKCKDLKINKDKALNLLKVREETYNRERNYLLEKYPDDLSLDEDSKITTLQSEDLDETSAKVYRNRIENLCNTLKLLLQEKLKEKSCLSVVEFKNKFIEYASQSKNRVAISEAEREFLSNSENFIKKVSEYEKVQNYEDAKVVLQNLSLSLDQLTNDKEKVLNIGKGMGYDSPSLEYLMEETAKLEPCMTELQELEGASLTVDQLLEKQKELELENYEQQFFDLQKIIRTPEKNVSQIQLEIDEKDKEVQEKSTYYNCLKIALEVMQEASDEMRQSFGPELNKKTATIFKNLTNGKYGNILVTKDYDISIQSGIHYREWRYLSNGTVDQAYLALRLAITELISDKNIALPIFLDDVLMQYDDERTDAALKFIADYANQKEEAFQILLFTCHQHIIDCAKTYTNQVVDIDNQFPSVAWNVV